MSTSLVYHGYGLRGYEYVSTRFEGGEIIFIVKHRPGTLRCPVCGSSDVLKRGSCLRRFLAPNIGLKPVSILIAIQRVQCRDCAAVRQVRLSFADHRRSYTRSFERMAVELSKRMTINDVALHMRVGWDLIKDIVNRHLLRRFSRPKLTDIRHIAIDEISVAKGHKYLTIVLDLGSGAVVFVGDGRGSDALDPFWKRLKRSGANVSAVAIDMSPAYIAAVINNLPKARIVFDHFHITKMMNDKLSKFRRDLHRETSSMLQKEVLKGTRWLLLKNPDNLDDKRREQERLDEALMINRPLAVAYYMKEDLREFWKQKSKRRAELFLSDWCKRALATRIYFLIKFAGTLLAHKSGILAYYNHRISTGPLEGINNKIKTMKRQAYGFRDMEFFKLKIMGIHETKYALVG